MPEEQYQDSGAQYHVLPDDPLAALNMLREAAGLEPLSSPDPVNQRTPTAARDPRGRPAMTEQWRPKELGHGSID